MKCSAFLQAGNEGKPRIRLEFIDRGEMQRLRAASTNAGNDALERFLFDLGTIMLVATSPAHVNEKSVKTVGIVLLHLHLR